MVFAPKRLVILGCGYLGLRLAACAKSRGVAVTATTRKAERVAELSNRGCEALFLSDDASTRRTLLASHVDDSTALVATFPPDGLSDALLSPLARRARASVYISSTGVYGNATGVIDDIVPAHPDSPRAEARLDAEAHWYNAGATILRVAAIYGPHRGQHERVRAGSARIAGDGRHHICRIHVDDLVRAIWRCVELELGAERYVVADDEPAPQGDVVRYLAQLLGVDVPASVPLEFVPETLRHDRRVDASRFKAHTGLTWLYPNYREGFVACLAAERAAPNA